MTDGELTQLFKEAKTIAVVGISNRPERASFGVARFLKAQGFRVIGVNPQLEEVLGERCYPALSAVTESVDIIDIFRRSETVLEIMPEAIQKRPRCIWMQEGVVNEEAAAMAAEAGIPVVMNKCILKELARLLPRF